MIFVDAGAWVALEMQSEKRHQEAAACMKRLGSGEHGALVTSDYILDEALTILRMKAGIAAAESLAKRAFESPSVRLAFIGPETFQSAWTMMHQHLDKRWSLTDCSSFLLMTELGIEVSFTFDKNFKEAGFRTEPT